MKIKVNDQDVDAQVIGFSTIGEPWTEYQLDNGDVLRFKTVILRVLRLADNPDGTRAYQTQSQHLMVVNEKEDS